MSKFCPAGVRYFGHTKSSDKGKFHTQDLGSGPNMCEHMGGGGAKHMMGKGSAGACPAGVQKNSGTEAHVTVTHKNASHGGPAKKAGASATPADVRHFGSSTP